MKTILILVLLASCLVAWRSDNVLDLIQGTPPARTASPAQMPVQVRSGSLAIDAANEARAAQAFLEGRDKPQRSTARKTFDILSGGTRD
ncbi:hypothetical protein [Noviherbaspirillum galbum]|uniref:Uncharacterized protein n=1 Tax=Noviherbaspirillum galbum TaxID=2709383 RepID=A0A6B3SQ75_9BURK|nr:hypothetical protein [Noviherbaspirillum galbum]NEX62913.1 hypothetical protein [Noviherbaspirillum galbum]